MMPEVEILIAGGGGGGGYYVGGGGGAGELKTLPNFDRRNI